jgi:hypothetical protein
VITLEAGELSVDVDPTRGLDLAAGRFAGERFSFGSPYGLLFTCGLGNVGVESEGQPKHGRYRTLAAQDVESMPRVAGGRVADGALELTREVTVSDVAVRVSDVVRNTGDAEEAAPLLYHVNLLWDTVSSDADEVVPRDDDARAFEWFELGPPGPERVYEHVGASHAAARFGALSILVRSSLPRLWQWINPSLGVLGLEPANCSVLGRAHDRAAGTLPFIGPGEERSSMVEIAVARA